MSKTWLQKFQSQKEVEIKPIEKDWAGFKSGSIMLIATPEIISQYVNGIPTSKFKTVEEMRKDLAQKYKTDFTCPLTTGIFLRIAIEKGFETNKVIPFWRIVSPSSPLAKKLSCGIDFLIDKQREENIEIN